jgi:hypothetical protein
MQLKIFFSLFLFCHDIHSQGKKHSEENHIINQRNKKKNQEVQKTYYEKLDEWKTSKRNNWGSLNKNRVFRKNFIMDT